MPQVRTDGKQGSSPPETPRGNYPSHWLTLLPFCPLANLKLRDFFNELKKYAGKQVEVRFVGLAEHVRDRFERARPGWQLVEADTPLMEGNIENERKEIMVRVFPSVSDAIIARKYSDVGKVVEEKSSSEHVESV